MTAAGDRGQLRASDADRERVQALLAEAYGEGRLDWAEMDARSTALSQAVTYADLGRLTWDLPGAQQLVPAYPVAPVGPARMPPPPARNSLAVAALCCGLGQFVLGFPVAIPAIICGHKARAQIRSTGQDGMGMATAGLVLGYVGLGLVVLVVLLFVNL